MQVRIGISNGWLSEEIPFIFLFEKRKMWNDADGFRCVGMLFADGGRSAIAVRREGAAANCAVLRTAIFTRVSPSRGRSDFGKRAGAATER